mgnify:CR=1 FL=1
MAYYNVSSSPSQWDVNYVSFSGSSYSIDASFSRRITLKATKSSTSTYYPYTQYVYLDGSLLQTTSNTTNTSSSVRISSLAGYTNYISKYNFNYAIVDYVRYSASATVSLTAGSTT